LNADGSRTLPFLHSRAARRDIISVHELRLETLVRLVRYSHASQLQL
jgi:hypothetical protein